LILNSIVPLQYLKGKDPKYRAEIALGVVDPYVITSDKVLGATGNDMRVVFFGREEVHPTT
jgi:ribulose 1,5-bisphosphate synthetase/thiazole synthase